MEQRFIKYIGAAGIGKNLNPVIPGAVSYTHLDVYKRQLHHHGNQLGLVLHIRPYKDQINIEQLVADVAETESLPVAYCLNLPGLCLLYTSSIISSLDTSGSQSL